MNPQAPTTKNLTKLHKKDPLIRPLMNYIQTPTYKVSKLITQILNNKIYFIYKYAIVNRKVKIFFFN